MSDVTPQRRVLPARERHDSAAKRRASISAAPPTPTTEPRVKRKYTKRASLNKPSTPLAATPTPSDPAEDRWPIKVQASKPLPTSTSKQPDKLSTREYQSIAESAVLAASLHRSRMQWLSEGVFKRYWTKPVKRKGVIEQPEGNPDAKSMQKLGNASMTIEPHVFDVTFYTVKDPANVLPPYQRHANQHTVKHMQPHPPTISMSPSPGLAPTAPKQDTTPKPPTPVIPAVAAGNGEHVKPEESTSQAHGATVRTIPAVSYAASKAPISVPAAGGPPKPAADPVIQMLAARAATDSRLKELMKVVATSQAMPDQLKEFQAHIDEFNKIIKQQEAKKESGEKDKQTSTLAAAHPASYSVPQRPGYPGPPLSMGGPMNMPPPSHAAYTPRPEPFIRHIVVEFHSEGASTDRWLFPEYAVLDIKSGGMEMVASFFIERKGEEIFKRLSLDEEGEGAFRAKLNPEVEYYQPVTMFIKATQHRTIETIARAAKPLVECQKHMKEVMEKKSRVPQEYLVLRLPRDRIAGDVGSSEFVDSAVEMSNDEDDELRDFYTM